MYYIIVCSKFHASKNSYDIKISQLICIANSLAGFYMVEVLVSGIFEQTSIHSNYVATHIGASNLRNL